jgi:formamidopyrimidine-DNA glycosylase
LSEHVPELPEVETVAADLRRRVVGATIEDVWSSRQRLRGCRIDVMGLRRAAVGAAIESARRRGKYLLLELSSSRVLLFHLGMTGNLLLAPARLAQAPHTHLVLTLDRLAGRRAGVGDEALELRFVDPRRFGLCRVVARAAQLERVRELAQLGPEPLDAGFSVATLAAALRGLSRDIKSVLMDQRRIAGLGNIYASEVLWTAGIHPRTPAGRLGPVRLARLHGAIRHVLAEAVSNRGTTFRDFADPAGQPGEHLRALHVYQRAGQPCARCQTLIRSVFLGQRSTFFCPRCQRSSR